MSEQYKFKVGDKGKVYGWDCTYEVAHVLNDGYLVVIITNPDGKQSVISRDSFGKYGLSEIDLKQRSGDLIPPEPTCVSTIYSNIYNSPRANYISPAYNSLETAKQYRMSGCIGTLAIKYMSHGNPEFLFIPLEEENG